MNTGIIVESKLKELHPTMPIIYIKAVTQEINVNHFFAKTFLFALEYNFPGQARFEDYV